MTSIMFSYLAREKVFNVFLEEPFIMSNEFNYPILILWIPLNYPLNEISNFTSYDSNCFLEDE